MSGRAAGIEMSIMGRSGSQWEGMDPQWEGLHPQWEELGLQRSSSTMPLLSPDDASPQRAETGASHS